MKAGLSLDDLARNCQGFGLMIGAKIVGKVSERRKGDVNKGLHLLLYMTFSGGSRLKIALQEQRLPVDLGVVVRNPADTE